MSPQRREDWPRTGGEPEGLDEELAARVDQLVGMLWRINERLSAVETRVGMDVRAEAGTPGLTVKGAAYASGYSESALRKMAREGRIGHAWVGGRLFITPPPARRKCT